MVAEVAVRERSSSVGAEGKRGGGKDPGTMKHVHSRSNRVGLPSALREGNGGGGEKTHWVMKYDMATD